MGFRQSVAGIKGAGRDARVWCLIEVLIKRFIISTQYYCALQDPHPARPSLLLCTAVVEGSGFFRGLKVIPA